MKKKFEDAIEKAYLKLSAMNDDDFEALLINNENGEYAKIVRATNFPNIGAFDEPLLDFVIGHQISFHTYIKSSHSTVLDANILSEWLNYHVVPDDICKVTAVDWILNTEFQGTMAVDWDIQDQEYLWAMAA